MSSVVVSSAAQRSGGAAVLSAGATQMPLFERRSSRAIRIDFHAVSRPARTFTGDFYFTRHCGDRLWFALGDVAGKGLSAAVVMEMIQEELEERFNSCARNDVDPAAMLQRLDAFLRPHLPSNRFVSVVAGQLREDGTLIIANAGHCPPLIARRDGRVERIPSTGPVIGILPSASWKSFATTLARDEALLVYSDGLPEATSPADVEFGIERIERALAASPMARSARRITAELSAAVSAHAHGQRADDLTMIAIARRGDPLRDGLR